MSDILDKLAMEVAEWSAVGFHKAELENEYYGMLSDPLLEEQRLQRRKELINEPDDSDAPEWAEWKAQDSCGKWFWYPTKPTVGERMWFVVEEGWQGSNNGKIPAGHYWRASLKEVNHLISADEMLNTLEEMMDDLKEVKLAWANGETVQYYFNDHVGGKDWGRVRELRLDFAEKWRVKPKTRTHTQWERKFYCPDTHVVLTAFNTWSDQFPSNARWVSEPEFRTYEIEE